MVNSKLTSNNLTPTLGNTRAHNVIIRFLQETRHYAFGKFLFVKKTSAGHSAHTIDVLADQ